MSHVDDGALHAYLDGALDAFPRAEASHIRSHLELCPDCAARLEAERDVRRDAERILGLAVPVVQAPTFEELRAYASATDRAPGPARLYKLGWVASILVAIGVGWFVRDGQLERVLASADAPPPIAADGSRRPAEPSPAEGPVPSEAGVREGAASDVAREVVRSAERAAPEPRPIEPVMVAEADVPPESAPRPVAIPSPSERMATSAAANRTIAVPEVDALTPPVLVATGSDVDEGTAGRGERTTVTALLDVGPTGRRVPPPTDEDLELPDEAPLVVPGVELVSIENLVEGTAPSGVHIVQRLSGGATLDVFHLPQDVAPSILPRLAAGQEEVRGRRGTEWVILRADLDRATLLELLARLNKPD